MNELNITACPLNRTPQAAANKPLDPKLKHACAEVEGMFLNILLKEGLRPALEEAENGSMHAVSMLETAVEQMARTLGETGTLGLGETLTQQLGQYPVAYPMSTNQHGSSPSQGRIKS